MAATTYTYIDLNLSTIRHPGTSDIVKRYDADAVRSAVKNILATNKGEKLFNPEFGANLHSLLFELMTPATKILARRKIVEEIQRWEPRVIVSEVDILAPDAFGGIAITVEYLLAANPQETNTITINLQRAR